MNSYKFFSKLKKIIKVFERIGAYPLFFSLGLWIFFGLSLVYPIPRDATYLLFCFGIFLFFYLERKRFKEPVVSSRLFVFYGAVSVVLCLVSYLIIGNTGLKDITTVELLVAIFATPVMEELLLKYALYRFSNAKTVHIFFWVSVVLFTLLHKDLFWLHFGFGFFTNYLYFKYRSTLLCIFVHSVFNAIVCTLYLLGF